ncbi:MAG: PAS domain-containing sensor histidine kinase [Dehalococcoidia bacterium]
MTRTFDRRQDRHSPGGLPPRPPDLRQFAEALPHLVWHSLPDGRFDYVNADWCTFTGLSQAASGGDGWQQALHPDDLVRWQAAWNEGNDAGLPWELECRLRRTDNTYYWFFGRAEAVRGADGQIAGWVGIATVLDDRVSQPPVARHDVALPVPIAGQRRSGQGLPGAVGQQPTVIAVAAHDMKNQLGVILGLTQLTERHLRRASTLDPERILSNLEKIQHSTTKLEKLLEEFLDLSRLQSGELVEFNRQPTDLVALARECVDEYAQTSDRDLTLSTTAETLIGQWDAARLERVVANLLSNAIKYSGPSSAIHVTLAGNPAGGVAMLAVQDHGVGIPAADLPHIFEPYYRGSNVAQKTAGTGIGLFGARALIEQQGGTLRLESTAGSGTTLTIRLPRAPIPIPTSSAPPEMTTTIPTS